MKLSHIQVSRVLDLVKQIRPQVLPFFGNTVSDTKSNPRDLVTKLDIQTEAFLKRNLSQLFPSISFVGEETGGDRSCETFWLTDPIDGTIHFVRGIPHCSTMLSLVHNNKVVFSVIYDFARDVMFHAIKEGGSYKDNQRIYVSQRNLSESIFGWEIQDLSQKHTSVKHFLNKNTAFYNTLSAGFPFTLVAEGKIDGLVFHDPFGNDYDFAAGSLLVSEASGFVQNFNSSTYQYSNTNFIATNQIIGSKLKNTIEDIIS